MKLLEKIEQALQLQREGYPTSYISVEDLNGEEVKIRVSDHQGKASNNNIKTISFIIDSKVEQGWGYDRIVDEHLIDEDGYNESYQSVEDILDWADIDPNQSI